MILVVTGSPELATLPAGERWAISLLQAAVQHATTVVAGDAGGPDAWSVSAARTAGRRWAVYGLDGRVMRGHGPPVPWTQDAPPARDAEREEWAAWCLARDRALVRAASRAHAEGRGVRVLAIVVQWAASRGAEGVAEQSRRAGLEVVVRRFGEG